MDVEIRTLMRKLARVNFEPIAPHELLEVINRALAAYADKIGPKVGDEVAWGINSPFPPFLGIVTESRTPTMDRFMCLSVAKVDVCWLYSQNSEGKYVKIDPYILWYTLDAFDPAKDSMVYRLDWKEKYGL